jgi:hypothetical protein
MPVPVSSTSLSWQRLGRINFDNDLLLLQDGALCSECGRLNAAQFEAAMRHQLRQYAGRRISDFLYHGRGGNAENAQVNIIKEIERGEHSELSNSMGSMESV